MNKYIFIHIPKTGGTSIHSILPGANWHNIPGRVLTNKAARNKKLNKFRGKIHHYTIQQHIKAGLLSKEDFDEAFTFCFTRDPYDRLVSSFHYARKNFAFKGDFTQFVSEIEALSKVGIIRSRSLGAPNHLIPQYTFIDNEFSVEPDLIGKLETINEDIQKIELAIGLSGVKLEKKNTSNRKPTSYYFNKQLQDRVYKIYRVDFERFGYSKEL